MTKKLKQEIKKTKSRCKISSLEVEVEEANVGKEVGGGGTSDNLERGGFIHTRPGGGGGGISRVVMGIPRTPDAIKNAPGRTIKRSSNFHLGANTGSPALLPRPRKIGRWG